MCLKLFRNNKKNPIVWQAENTRLSYIDLS